MIVLNDSWQDKDGWDRFVESNHQARYCHLFGYGRVVACYGYVPKNICFLKDRTIVGVLPSVEAHGLLLQRKLISQPFSEYGGLLLDADLADQEIAEIFSLLSEYLQSHQDIRAIEMHGNH